MTVPYTTKTGIQIGILYQRKPVYECDPDAELIQEALLRKPKNFSWRELFRQLFWSL
jgi:hypothetical protein